MAIKGDYAQILAGLPISIFGANVAVTQPTVKDICAFGEDKFLSQVSIFLNLDSFTEKIKEGNSQLEMLSDFQIFMTVLNEDETFSQEILNFFELIFPNYHVVLDSGCIQFQLAEDRPFIGQINPMNFETFCDTLKELFIPFNADEVEYNPANDKAKEIAEKIKQGRKKRQKQKSDGENFSMYGTYVSCLAIGLPMDMNTLLNYTPFQLHDSFVRYNAKLSFDLYQRVATMPMMDTSSMKEPPSWLDDIYKSG